MLFGLDAVCRDILNFKLIRNHTRVQRFHENALVELEFTFR